MFENCVEIRKHFSDYLDGECDRETRRSVRYHLNYCVSCRAELDLRRTIQADLRALPMAHVPPQVSLGLRVALSQHMHRNLLGRAALFLENAIKPLMIPASAGVLMAILSFVLIMSSSDLPLANTAAIPPAPVSVSTPPRVRAFGPLSFPEDEEPLVLVTHVDDMGRVTYYQVLSGQESPALTHRLDQMMYSTYFQPAKMYGKPTDGDVVLSLRRITVRG